MKAFTRPFRLLALTVGFAAACLAWTGSAQAAAPPSGTCYGGSVSGTYSTLTIAGDCRVPDGESLTVLGNLEIASRAAFHGSTHSYVTIRGNVNARTGSVFELGCTFAHACDDGQDGSAYTDYVGGTVNLTGVYNAAINGVTIGGNLYSTGGGPGPRVPYVFFSVKDNIIHGGVTVSGLNTFWFGLIRNSVYYGSVTLNNNRGSDPDSNEVVDNYIGGNLNCAGNNPYPQLGDSGGGPNQVQGQAFGQCAGLTAPPVPAP